MTTTSAKYIVVIPAKEDNYFYECSTVRRASYMLRENATGKAYCVRLSDGKRVTFKRKAPAYAWVVTQSRDGKIVYYVALDNRDEATERFDRLSTAYPPADFPGFTFRMSRVRIA